MHKTDALVFIMNCPPSQERVAMCHPLPRMGRCLERVGGLSRLDEQEV